MRSFETGQTLVQRDVHRSGRVWSEHALRVVADTSEAWWAPARQEPRSAGPPCTSVKARVDDDR
ncbi:hypothetical protein [Streptomyces griseocarneus]|uniref:hypothetical protein n=1 Tax=Streptomyces griseocarneus TaxID=51201 RepID=UPI00167EC8AB|nr:hypothetical protein [Streptomyces griseocarneus]MBZ6476217.1 hypothetical protein [Streptomyces griseocarneus]GHG63323.1 hypothetical protein GCM10018779_32820 [Streptomyces griseocarneus]